MTDPADLQAARRRATLRRVAGVAIDFDPARLGLARRMAGLQRTRLGRAVEVTPAAITQYEKGQARPTLPVLDGLADVLGVPTEFFRAGHPIPALSASGAHFRSLRSTTVLERERALSFGEVVLAVFAALEQHVELPALQLPDLHVPVRLGQSEINGVARHARNLLGLPAGPVPHVIRLLEAHGVAVVHLEDAIHRVDAFSHQHGHRPLVLLNPGKQDKARSRFDAAHELGHLLMHHDAEPGSRLIEQQAHMFAAEFLTPAAELVNDLPKRIDWVVLHQLKRRWGISLKALVVRAHALGRFSESTYKRALRQLSSWGLPEPGSLGPPETPVLLPRALALLGPIDLAVQQLASDAGLPINEVNRVLRAAGGGDSWPTLSLDPRPN